MIKVLYDHGSKDILLAKHTEEERQFVVHHYKDGDFLLRDIFLPNDQRIFVISTRLQLPNITNTTWEHFKSTPEQPMTYVVHGLGIDLIDAKEYVLYSPQYQGGQKLMLEQQVDCLARPREMFFSGVSRDGYNGPRFRRIG